MNRDEFKQGLSDLVDEVVTENRDLTDADEDSLVDQLGEAASEIINSDADDEEEGENESATKQ